MIALKIRKKIKGSKKERFIVLINRWFETSNTVDIMNEQNKKTKRKKLKKLKYKIKYIEEYLSFCQNTVNRLESKLKTRKENQLKIMRTLITVSIVVFSIASFYSVFFK